MASTPATSFAPNMALITGNAGGAVQSLPSVTQAGGRERYFIERIPMTKQSAGSIIAVARVPIGAALTSMTVNTTNSLVSATLAFGDAQSGQGSKYGSAAKFTTVNSSSNRLKAAYEGLPLTVGYDSVSGLAVTGYEDVQMTVAVSALLSAGTLVIKTGYVMD